MQLSNLYFLVFPQINAVKIGKADDTENRYKILRKYWGEADLYNSYQVSLPSNEVYKYEKSLHILFSKFNKKLDKKDGSTEFFEIDILSDIISFFEKSTNYLVHKGVVFKEVEEKNLKKRKYIKDKYKKYNVSTFNTFSDICLKLFRLSKLITFLIKYQDRIVFQYDLIDGEYFFRMKLSEKITEKQFENLIEKIWNLLAYEYFCYNRQRGFYLSSWCTSSFKESKFQIVILNPLEYKNDFIPKAFIEIWLEMVQPNLVRLPKKSKACIDDIPIYFTS